MNNYIQKIEEKYKPYRYTIKGSTIHFFSTLGNFVAKPKTKDITELFKYLESRSFTNIPKIVEDDGNYIIYEYLDAPVMPHEQKILDLILVVSKLHNKTAYFKEVTEDKYKQIYEDIKGNIAYLKEYYSTLYDKFFLDVYSSPSAYYFLTNYSIIANDLDFCLNQLDDWFTLVKDIMRQRVCLLHNHLSLDHFIKGLDSSLISWDNYIFDTPVLDIVTLYKNEYLHCDFSVVLSEYLRNFKLSSDEEKLLFILISLPNKVEVYDNEFTNTCSFVDLIDYIYRTEKLIRPYYTEQQKEEN